MNDLKPCPCGNFPLLFSTAKYGYAFVGCPHCGKSTTKRYATDAKAASAWNAGNAPDHIGCDLDLEEHK